MISSNEVAKTRPPGAGMAARARFAAVFGALLVSALVYLPAIEGPLVLDDFSLVSGAAIGGGDSLIHCLTRPFRFQYYRPLVSVTFYIDSLYSRSNAHHLANPLFYHQTNILIHVVTTGLVIGLARAAFPTRTTAQMLAGLLFAVQPAQVSAVGWIGGRTDALVTMFAAASLWALVCGVRANGRARWVRLTASALMYGCALFSKEQAIVLLPAVPLAFRCFRPDERRVGWRASIPFAVVMLLYLAAWRAFGPSVAIPPEFPLSVQIRQFGQTIWSYTQLLAAPTPREMSRYTLVAPSEGGAAAICGLAVAAFAVGLFVVQMRARPRAAWLVAIVALPVIPVANIVATPTLLVSPYRVALSGIGIAILFALVVDRIAARFVDRSLPNARGTAAAIVAGFALTLWWSALTVWGASQWGDDFRLGETLARYNSNALRFRAFHAYTMMQRGDLAGARRLLERALADTMGSDWSSPAAMPKLLTAPSPVLDRVRETEGSYLPPGVIVGDVYKELGHAAAESRDYASAHTYFQIGSIAMASNVDRFLGAAELAGRTSRDGKATDRRR